MKESRNWLFVFKICAFFQIKTVLMNEREKKVGNAVNLFWAIWLFLIHKHFYSVLCPMHCIKIEIPCVLL